MRSHHYELAHHALRKVCAADPRRFYQLLASPERTSFLRWIWTWVRKISDQAGDPGFEITDLSVSTLHIKNYPTILIELPPPQQVPEAHFIAIVLNQHDPEKRSDSSSGFRYFTLEKGETLAGIPRSVFCEWIGGDKHMNYGGLTRDQDSYLRAVEKKILAEV